MEFDRRMWGIAYIPDADNEQEAREAAQDALTHCKLDIAPGVNLSEETSVKTGRVRPPKPEPQRYPSH